MEKYFKKIRRWAPVFALLAVLFLPAIASAEIDVTSNVEIQKSRLAYDRRTQATSLDISLKNISTDGLSPTVRAVIEDTTDSSIQVTNADGTTQEGKPYFDYAELAPGMTSDPKNWVFSNPKRLRFSYTIKIFLVSTDSDPPTALITNPPNNAVISNTSPLITIEYHDELSGINTDSFQASINGSSATALFSVTESNASYQLTSPLAQGTHKISASISDAQGNTATVESNFTVEASSEPLKYIFSLADNDWVFASSGDGTCMSYLNRNALGLPDYSDVTALTQVIPNDDFYFGLAGKESIYISLGDGSNTSLHTNANMGAGSGVQVTSLHIDPSDNGYFNLAAQPDILQSVFDGSNSLFMDGSLLGLSDSDTIECLHIGYDDTVYFCSSDKSTILASSGSSTNSSFLTAEDLGVPGSEINAFAFLPETVLPDITITYPVNGAFINTITPNIIVSFSDKDSGIDKSSFSAELNGSDVSSSFTVTDTGASYQIHQGAELPVGNNTLTVSIKDMVGNESSTASNFTTGILRAIPGATPVSGTAPLTVNFTADGEDPAGTIEIFRWDFDGNGSYNTYDTVARDYNRTYSTPGVYNATLYVWSSTGEIASATIQITVQNNPPTATADILPSNGEIPLIVQMTGSGSDSDGSVAKYEWDFDGDGIYDWSSTSTGNTTYTYTEEGTFNAVFRVTDNSGLTATARATTTTVRTGPPGSPTAIASASPSSGNAPLSVTLSGSATDPDNNVVRYEWDFDNDGTYDWSSDSTGNTNYTYNEAGTHVATLRVTDSDNLTGIDQVVVSVNIQTSLSIQNNTVGFLSDGSEEINGATASSYYSSSYAPDKALDENTGTYWHSAYEYNATSYFEVTFKRPQEISGFTIQWYSTSYMYNNAIVELFDANGISLYSEEIALSGSTSQVTIPQIENAMRLRLTDNSSNRSYYLIREFDVDSEPMSTNAEIEPDGTEIDTSISADATVTVLIKNAEGEIIRTLVNNEYRTLGSYSDSWDCKDDNGVVVNDGVYHAVMQYIYDGEVKTYDLTDTTGGTRYSFPISSGCNTRSGTWTEDFSPFDDEQEAFQFTLCSAQEVTFFIGPLYSGADQTRVRTILNRQAFPAGTHTIYWDGLNDTGEIAQAPSGDSLITGAWLYSLSDNAMVMTGNRPVVSNVAATPNYFSPFSEKCDENGNGEGVAISYNLSEDVTSVELKVYSIETSSLLRTSDMGSASAGENTLFWDGKNDNGEYMDIGDYRIGIVATDSGGNESMFQYTLVRIDY